MFASQRGARLVKARDQHEHNGRKANQLRILSLHQQEQEQANIWGLQAKAALWLRMVFTLFKAVKEAGLEGKYP